jgi:hypothetical protein
MAESFLYDPTETINKGFAQFQAGLGNAFTQIIAQKQNDYVTAEKTFQNIDALTDKLGEYGQEEITGKTSALMNQAAKDIIKNGQLDYSALGNIRSEVTKIKNRKSAIEAGTQMLKDWTQTSLASKDDLTSLTTTLSDLRGILLNPNNLSAADMGRQMQAAYTKNVNTTKVSGDLWKQLLPATEFTETVEKDGNRYQVGGMQVSGYQYDKATGRFTETGPTPMIGPDGQPLKNPDGSVKMVSKVQQAIQAFKTQGKPALDAIRMQMGPEAATLTDDQLAANQLQRYVENNNRAGKELLVKDKNELSILESNAKVSKATAENIDTKINLENENTRTGIELNQAKIKEANMNSDLMFSNTVDVTNDSKTGFTGKRIPIAGKDEKGSPVNMVVNSIITRRMPNGELKEFYQGVQNTGNLGYVGVQNATLNGKQIEIPVTPYNQTSFNSVINMQKKDRPIIMKAINAYKSTALPEASQQGPVISESAWRLKHPEHKNWTAKRIGDFIKNNVAGAENATFVK